VAACGFVCRLSFFFFLFLQPRCRHRRFFHATNRSSRTEPLAPRRPGSVSPLFFLANRAVNRRASPEVRGLSPSFLLLYYRGWMSGRGFDSPTPVSAGGETFFSSNANRPPRMPTAAVKPSALSAHCASARNHSRSGFHPFFRAKRDDKNFENGLFFFLWAAAREMRFEPSSLPRWR